MSRMNKHLSDKEWQLFSLYFTPVEGATTRVPKKILNSPDFILLRNKLRKLGYLSKIASSNPNGRVKFSLSLYGREMYKLCKSQYSELEQLNKIHKRRINFIGEISYNMMNGKCPCCSRSFNNHAEMCNGIIDFDEKGDPYMAKPGDCYYCYPYHETKTKFEVCEETKYYSHEEILARKKLTQALNELMEISKSYYYSSLC